MIGVSDVRAEPKVRAVFLLAFLGAAAETGLDTARLLRQGGLDRASLSSPFGWIALRSYVAMIERIAEETGSSDLGLEKGSSFLPETLGPFYMLLMTAETLGEMLRIFIRFQGRWQTHTCLELYDEGETFELRYLIHDLEVWPRRQDAEFTLAAVTRCIRLGMGERWRPLRVRFEHEVTPRRGAVHEFFRCPVQGGSSSNAIVFTRGAMDSPVPLRNRADFGRLQLVIERQLIDLLPHNGAVMAHASITDRVRWLLAQRLGAQDIQLPAVAAELGLPERSLRRHLAAAGVGFRQLLQDERMKHAARLLEQDATVPLTVLAERLGYSDAAAFSRAFKDWHGLSPRRFAKRDLGITRSSAPTT